MKHLLTYEWNRNETVPRTRNEIPMKQYLGKEWNHNETIPEKEMKSQWNNTWERNEITKKQYSICFIHLPGHLISLKPLAVITSPCWQLPELFQISGRYHSISNAIYVRERSLKQTSTASWLIFAHSLLPPPPPSSPSPSPSPPSASHVNRQWAPPLYWGMWAWSKLPRLLRSKDAGAATPPLSKGMWAG